MSLEELLAELRDLGGNLSLGAGGKLNLDIPVGVLTEELKEYLRFYKDDLVELLTPKAVDESLSSWEEDSVLPGSFKFSPPRRSHDLKVVLLTGATGFLGKYLLFELLSQTKCHVYCLVRSGGGGFASGSVDHRIKRREAMAGRVCSASQGNRVRPFPIKAWAYDT